MSDLRELLTRADSYLSLLWHRHVPPERKSDAALAHDVERTIGDLRMAVRALPGRCARCGLTFDADIHYVGTVDSHPFVAAR
jgi:hypothetical protein